MALTDHSSSIPSAVLKRCYGKQSPITPHQQKLLLAARREAKAPQAKAAGKSKKPTKGKGKGKGRGKSLQGKGSKGPKAKSDYAIAKADFLGKLFLAFNMCSLVEILLSGPRDNIS